MTIDLSALLDQLEDWLEAQVPPNLQELPVKMLETVERVSNEIIESLNMHGPPSISIPFPPFGKGSPTPPPPPPPPPMSLTTRACGRATSYSKAHPLLVTAGAALVISVGIGAVGIATGAGIFEPYGRQWRQRRKFGTHGVVENGMLKEAIVLLAPSPTPPLLVPLAATLLKHGYIVLVAVPHVEEAEVLERRLSGLGERSALRVLIYDPDDSTTFPAFHRSLNATLTLRFPSSRQSSSADPYNPRPAQVPRIHAFVSLYPLNPSPPSQPGPLPALPTLISPGPSGHVPMLVTLYPSTATLVTPDSFASQVLTTNHRLLGSNLVAMTNARVISLFVGNITLPSLPAIITESRTLSRREQARQRLRESAGSATATFSVLRDLFAGGMCIVYKSFASFLGIGAASRDYSNFETTMLRILKPRLCAKGRTQYFVGQRSFLPIALGAVPPRILPRILTIMPAMPSETGPAPAPPSKTVSAASTVASRSNSAPASRSASSSDHEGGEDLASSIHTADTARSSADSSGLDGSWVGLDAEGA